MGVYDKQRPVVRTMQGKEIDMAKLAAQNELTVAVGNVKVNARGDELGPGGKIIRKREDVLRSASEAPGQNNVRKVDTSEVFAPPVVAKKSQVKKEAPTEAVPVASKKIEE